MQVIAIHPLICVLICVLICAGDSNRPRRPGLGTASAAGAARAADAPGGAAGNRTHACRTSGCVGVGHVFAARPLTGFFFSFFFVWCDT